MTWIRIHFFPVRIQTKTKLILSTGFSPIQQIKLLFFPLLVSIYNFWWKKRLMGGGKRFLNGGWSGRKIDWLVSLFRFSVVIVLVFRCICLGVTFLPIILLSFNNNSSSTPTTAFHRTTAFNPTLIRHHSRPTSWDSKLFRYYLSDNLIFWEVFLSICLEYCCKGSAITK